MDHVLPPRLGALLALELDVPFADRLRRVLESASRAISKLGELELIKYEDNLPIDDTADLSLWEAVAPLVAETIANVNAVTAEIDRHFPTSELVSDSRHDEVRKQLHAAAVELHEWVREFGLRVRDPSMVGDRWNLITELQIFRSKFRNRVGSMVWEAASQLGECKRRDVEPGYDEALAQTLVVRSTTADLRRLMHARIHKVGEAAPTEVITNLTQIEKELNAFGRTAAWRALRAQDKKVILEFRARTRELAARPDVSKLDVLSALEPFVEFVDEFKNINQREILLQHDLEMQANVGVVLERATNASGYADQLAAFNEALGYGQSLYGRSEEFDAFLRKLRKVPPNQATLPHEVDQFLGLLAGLANA